MFQKRQKEIINRILDSDNPLAGKQLAKKLNVSSRTVRADIKSINEVLAPYMIEIGSSKQEGYFMSEDAKKILLQLLEGILNNNEDDFGMLPNTPSERFAFIVLKLSFTSNFISMESLAGMIFVSKTTINYDIKKILKFLSGYNGLELVISPLKGLMLKGNEESKRILISNIFNGSNIKDNLTVLKKYSYLLLSGDIDREILFLYETILNVLYEFGYFLIDKDVNLLLLDVFISIKRIQLGFHMEENIHKNLDLTIVNSFKKEIEKYFKIEINENELKYFQQSFDSKRLLNMMSDIQGIKEETEELVTDYLEEVKKQFNIDFSKNDSFKNNLMMHIDPMINRLKNNQLENNPLKDEIKNNYPFAFEVATVMISIIKEKLKVTINESELTYIALHVAAALEEMGEIIQVAIICGSGLGTAQLIKRRLTSYFNNQIHILGHFPLYQLNNVLKGEFGKVDLIVSTLPLQRSKDVPVVQVNPLIVNDDLLKIKEYVNNPLIGMNKQNIDNLKYNAFKNELFEYFDKETDYFDCILKLTKKLKEQKLIEDEGIFYQSVLERESLYSTILDGMIAIPHPMESFSKNTVVSVGILANSIKHGGKKIKLILLFAFNAKECDTLMALYGILEELLNSPVKINELSKCRSYEAFIGVLKSKF